MSAFTISYTNNFDYTINVKMCHSGGAELPWINGIPQCWWSAVKPGDTVTCDVTWFVANFGEILAVSIDVIVAIGTVAFVIASAGAGAPAAVAEVAAAAGAEIPAIAAPVIGGVGEAAADEAAVASCGLTTATIAKGITVEGFTILFGQALAMATAGYRMAYCKADSLGKDTGDTYVMNGPLARKNPGYMVIEAGNWLLSIGGPNDSCNWSVLS